jgi:hypothetical protein
MSGNAWQNWFRVIAQTRDYDGRSGIDKGDDRLSVAAAATTLLSEENSFTSRKRSILYVIAIWRQAAQDGLLPHPGEITPGAEKLQDVPGWGEAEWPDPDLFDQYLDVLAEDPPPLPIKANTKQCNRSKTLASIPTGYMAREDPEPKRLLVTFAALGQRLLEVEEWTEADCEAWRTQVEPMLDNLIGIIPCGASDHEPERNTEVDGDDHEGARAS